MQMVILMDPHNIGQDLTKSVQKLLGLSKLCAVLCQDLPPYTTNPRTCQVKVLS